MSDTPISDAETHHDADTWLPWVYADKVKQLERAANAMEEALVEAISYVDRMGHEGVRERTNAALEQYRRLNP